MIFFTILLTLVALVLFGVAVHLIIGFLFLIGGWLAQLIQQAQPKHR